jgi:hypothetical protein
MKSKTLLVFGLVIAFAMQACTKGEKIHPHQPQPADVYVGGFTVASNGKYVATYWKNGVATVFGDSTVNSVVTSIAVVGTDVYMSGFIRPALGNAAACYWKNGTITTLGDGSVETRATGIAVSGTDVYVSGTVGIVQSVAVYWKNGTQIMLGNNLSASAASAIAVNGNDVYVAGFSDNNHASYWKNGKDSVLTTTDVGNCSDVLLNGNDIYLAGFVGGSGGATYWKNDVPVTLSQQGSPFMANGIAVSGADVYVSGRDNNGPYGGYWKNGALTKFDLGTVVNDIAVNEGDVYLAGVQTSVTPQKNNAVYWKNNTMVILPGYGEANSITVVTR